MPVHTVRDNGNPEPIEAPTKQRPGITRRAVALIVVVLILVMSYASSLRIWISTEQENAENRASIERSQARIDELNADLARWDDPDYVRAQARDRLGWVMPGETGYRVIGPDGKPIGTQLQRPEVDAGAPVPETWWSACSGRSGLRTSLPRFRAYPSRRPVRSRRSPTARARRPRHPRRSARPLRRGLRAPCRPAPRRRHRA